MDLPVAGGMQWPQQALDFTSWLAGLVWLVKHEAAEHFLLHLSAACNPYSAGKSGSTTLAFDLASCWGPLRWPPWGQGRVKSHPIEMEMSWEAPALLGPSCWSHCAYSLAQTLTNFGFSGGRIAPASHQRQRRRGRMRGAPCSSGRQWFGRQGLRICLGGKGQCWCPASPLCSLINPDLMVPEEFALSLWPAGGGKMLEEERCSQQGPS